MATASTGIDEIKRVLSGIKQEIGDSFGVAEIGVFGSCSRGDADDKSDVDILVSFSREIDYFEFLELEEYLGNLVGRHVDLVEKKALKPNIGRRILEETVML